MERNDHITSPENGTFETMFAVIAVPEFFTGGPRPPPCHPLPLPGLRRKTGRDQLTRRHPFRNYPGN